LDHLTALVFPHLSAEPSARMPKKGAARAATSGRRTRSPSPTGQLMNDHEWDDFWRVLDAKRQRFAEDDAWTSAQMHSEDDELLPDEEEQEPEPELPLELKPDAAVATEPPPKGKVGRVNRCGACSACRSKDCGTCKNCLDKPRFGGPGIKKKACISRVCMHTQTSPARDDESDGDSTPASSPALRACAPVALPPPLFLPDRFPLRQPLLPIDMQPPATGLLSMPSQYQQQQLQAQHALPQHTAHSLPHQQIVQLDLLLPRPPSVTRAH